MRPPAPRRAGPFGVLAATFWLGIPGGLAGTVEPGPLEIRVHARAVRAGEPLRIEVTSATPLAKLAGSFLDREILFVAGNPGSRPERWTGWTLVDLDQSAGKAALGVEGRTTRDGFVRATTSLTIEPSAFPHEALDVAPRYVEPPPEVGARLAREKRDLEVIYAARRAAPPPDGRFLRPVDGAATSVFGTRRVFNGHARAPHSGLDLQAASGTVVRSSGAGLVVLARDLYYSGLTVILDHGGGLFTIYAHLSGLAVSPGDEVRLGETLGRSGATGRVTGPHLHWGAKIGELPFDPLALLDERLFPADSGSTAPP